ncbi:MAG: hypothetical protein UR79_C0002G0036 [Candidatus Campbellbacteria bacterium GW2011_GWD1_35_49]|nr:MAG: hypothetical protein UR74_C0002G0297 [Candidatus Campbellbacteria bacterium GW2011_GWD2_35_24]KKP75917.1 MAG: hypothetical protein UR75_C0002G0298 [Candidatus Campbellbacteria bacterium GW2011_GWC2_35_28]KKP76835.1 MAG: hypothetical protein UR76_C0002G0036 [Candidatus Campbellbacteria bacterium GW2011_GWC1_35_31]KKP78761.1 MAG: hypothetical protein UR79_C0002G0036 [Candidatus Campbellbacteria bacterium GW2011_GWD1_35_49]
MAATRRTASVICIKGSILVKFSIPRIIARRLKKAIEVLKVYKVCKVHKVRKVMYVIRVEPREIGN